MDGGGGGRDATPRQAAAGRCFKDGPAAPESSQWAPQFEEVRNSSSAASAAAAARRRALLAASGGWLRAGLAGKWGGASKPPPPLRSWCVNAYVPQLGLQIVPVAVEESGGGAGGCVMLGPDEVLSPAAAASLGAKPTRGERGRCFFPDWESAKARGRVL